VVASEFVINNSDSVRMPVQIRLSYAFKKNKGRKKFTIRHNFDYIA